MVATRYATQTRSGRDIWLLPDMQLKQGRGVNIEKSLSMLDGDFYYKKTNFPIIGWQKCGESLNLLFSWK